MRCEPAVEAAIDNNDLIFVLLTTVEDHVLPITYGTRHLPDPQADARSATANSGIMYFVTRFIAHLLKWGTL